MELLDARKRLDNIDSELLELFERRMEVVSTIAAYKHAHGLPTQDSGREQEIFNRVGEQVSEELVPYALDFIRKLLELSRKYQDDWGPY